ncbi:unnamed protein product [Rotaria magnacalcarata]|uniref:Uncharacterized protein n=1 Tax=Rotaria magnacalcarata TaxID=392030 RepID=A0A819ZMT4_9BILA|nr:unnamed protein product [Rotaria magnacalcarata]
MLLQNILSLYVSATVVIKPNLETRSLIIVKSPGSHHEVFQPERWRATIDFVRVTNDANEIVNVVRDIQNESVFVIVDTEWCEQIVTRIHQLQQVYKIFIFNQKDGSFEKTDSERSPDGQSTARVLSSTALPPLKSNKRAGTYTSFDKLRADLSQQTRLCEKSFNLISNINEQLSPSNGFTLNRLIGSYTTAFSKFLDILLEKKPNENGKKLLAQKCRIYITGNTSTLNMIDEFEQTYENQNAIWWYTRDGFLFRLLNRTFRQENIQMIIYLHFFLFDLHQQLTVTYQSSNPRTGIEKYFRGQTMELEEIKN